MSVGHVARGLEAAGLPTVSVFIKAFRHHAEAMGLARTVVTRHPMGRPLGPPHDDDTHRRTVEAALRLLDTATEPRTILELEQPYRPPGQAGR